MYKSSLSTIICSCKIGVFLPPLSEMMFLVRLLVFLPSSPSGPRLVPPGWPARPRRFHRRCLWSRLRISCPRGGRQRVGNGSKVAKNTLLKTNDEHLHCENIDPTTPMVVSKSICYIPSIKLSKNPCKYAETTEGK